MANEKHDPWALLREARDFMRQAAISRGPCPDCTECDHRDAIIAKADAALAAHDAVPPSEVEWLSLCDGQENRLSLADGTRLYACSHGDGHWGWSVNRPSSYGYANTLDEAQRAALSAARGLK